MSSVNQLGVGVDFWPVSKSNPEVTDLATQQPDQIQLLKVLWIKYLATSSVATVAGICNLVVAVLFWHATAVPAPVETEYPWVSMLGLLIGNR